AGSATATANDGPRASRSAMASVRPAKPPPAIRTSVVSRGMIPFYHAGAGLDDGRRTTEDGGRIRKYPSVVCRPSSVLGASMPSAVQEVLDILDLEPLEGNLFRGRSPQSRWQRVFGGQVIGQALVAACRTAGGG